MSTTQDAVLDAVEIDGWESIRESFDSFEARIHRDDLVEARAAFGRSVSEGQPFDFALRLQTERGAYRRCRAAGALSRDARNRPSQWSCRIQVISELSEAQRERDETTASDARLGVLAKLDSAVLAVAAKRSLREALHVLVSESREIVGAQHATGIYGPEIDRGRVLTTTAVSSEFEAYRDYFASLDGKSLLAALGPDGEAVQSFQQDALPERTAQGAPDHGWPQPPPRSGLLVPLLSRDRGVLGLIYLTGKLVGEFCPNDEAILSQFTQISAYVLELHHNNDALEERVRDRTTELAIANRELSRSNEDLEQFAYVSSHDLQEPLRAVAGYCQLLEEDFGENIAPAGRAYMHNIVDGAKRMQRLINDLLLYARVSRKTMPFEPTDCNLAVAEALKNLELMVAETHATIHCDPLPLVQGDKGQFVQLFQNLIGNALKYRGEKPPQISISASETEDEWTFSFSDNGIGIAPKFRERIFVIFQRLHTREKFEGTGIGLAVCKRIVNRHGGKIWVEANGDEGSVFHFTLAKDSRNGRVRPHALSHAD